MSVVSNNLLLAAEDGGYVIDRSLRFRASASAYLNRTFGTGSTTRWTWSAWGKRGVLGTNAYMFSPNNVNGEGIYFNSSNQFSIALNGAILLTSNAVYRDPSAWYHIVVVSDMGNATASLRCRVYINGVEITSWATDARASYSSWVSFNSAVNHNLGVTNANTIYWDGYLTEVNFIDGQALEPSSFGEFDAITGVWKPKRFAGTYGTNGFYLDFKDPTNTTTLTADKSGRGNNWTANNISLTSGATYDSMIDTPTPVADVRGNFCVVSPLDSSSASNASVNGNLDLTITSNAAIRGSFYVSTGKWYYEVRVNTLANLYLGLASNGGGPTNFTSTSAFGVNNGGDFYEGGALQSEDSIALAANSTYGIAFDADAKKFWIAKDGQWYSCDRAPDITINASDVVAGNFGYDFSTLTGNAFTPHFGNSDSAGANISANFGQRPFAYTPPSGFKALHTGNLPEPAIVDGRKQFNAVLYTGNGSTRSVTGVGFQPDLVWVKGRSNAYDHELYDAVRGTTRRLMSSFTGAEDIRSGVTSFNADGFTLGSAIGANENNASMVGWNWRASNAAAVTNTAGSITSTVSANPTAGFSIVTWTGDNNADSRVGHGLGVTPQIVIIKPRSASGAWYFQTTIIDGSYDELSLNTTSAKVDRGSPYTPPTSTTFTNYGPWGGTTLVAYCFAEVPGYSRFGSYTGNGSADGPFVFCGFRPRFVMFKRTDATGSWTIYDTARNPSNVVDKYLWADLSNAEATFNSVDILSNGFKMRETAVGNNTSGGTYIFMAFSESPFKHALAR